VRERRRERAENGAGEEREENKRVTLMNCGRSIFFLIRVSEVTTLSLKFERETENRKKITFNSIYFLATQTH